MTPPIHADVHVVIAKRLRLARLNADITQQKAADVINVERPTVSHIETGRRIVSAIECYKLCNLYNIDIRKVLDMDDNVNFLERVKP